MPSPAKLLASASGASVDPNFRNVTLLLHGDGSNGAQNNTFIDSSTNNFTITRNGNTTQGSLSPYGSRWSNYFDGNGDYLSISNTSALDLPGDFTIEFWWNPSSLSGTQSLVGKWTFNQFAWLVQATSSNIILQTASGTGVTTISNAWSPSIGQWYHIAFTRSGTDVRAFVNGSQVGTTQTSSRTCSSTATFGVGANMDGPQEYSTGYISDLRVVKGTAVYTAAFTPPTAPLTAITNTSLLTCQSNRFRDASTNNFAITRNGDVRVTPFSPYAPTAPYSAATNGGSMYFDGNGDYLSIADNAAFDLAAGDWTVETWVNFSALPAASGAMTFVSQWEYSLGWFFYLFNNAGTYQLYLTYSTNGSNQVNLSVNLPSAPSINTWNHVAFVRSGTNFYVFWNGTQVGSTQTLNATIFNSTSSVNIGQATTTYYMNGYLANLRVVKGTAVYTANFTPPTTPVTAITNTSLLVNGTNAAIIDSTAGNDLETVGNTQISTSVKKFGTGSMSFNGSTDWLVTPNKPEHNFGTGDFTIEAWVYPTGTSSQSTIISNYNGPSSGFSLQLGSTGPVFGWGDPVLMTGSSAIAQNAWSHIAITRAGTSLRMFLNGTQIASATNSTDFTGTGALFIGRLREATAGFYWQGYLDDLRITKGVARYTANFTPPTAAFPDQ